MAVGYIIPKQTAGMTSETIDLTHEPFPKTVHVAGILVAETIAVNIVDAAGVAQAMYDFDGNAVFITATSPPLTVPSPIKLQFVKPITGNAVGVQLVTIDV